MTHARSTVIIISLLLHRSLRGDAVTGVPVAANNIFLQQGSYILIARIAFSRPKDTTKSSRPGREPAVYNVTRPRMTTDCCRCATAQSNTIPPAVPVRQVVIQNSPSPLKKKKKDKLSPRVGKRLARAPRSKSRQEYPNAAKMAAFIPGTRRTGSPHRIYYFLLFFLTTTLRTC